MALREPEGKGKIRRRSELRSNAVESRDCHVLYAEALKHSVCVPRYLLNDLRRRHDFANQANALPRPHGHGFYVSGVVRQRGTALIAQQVHLLAAGADDLPFMRPAPGICLTSFDPQSIGRIFQRSVRSIRPSIVKQVLGIERVVIASGQQALLILPVDGCLL